MKRILSMALALVMAMSVMTAFSVSANETAEQGRDGEITVFLRDFENGEKLGTDGGAIGSVKDDGTGNKYGASNLTTAKTIMNVPKKNETEKRLFVVLGGRFNVSNQIPYISGKVYRLSWKLAQIKGTEITPLGKGSSGINGMVNTVVGDSKVTGLLAYKKSGNNWVDAAEGQVYAPHSQLPYYSKDESSKVTESNDGGTAWREYSYNNMKYQLCNHTYDSDTRITTINKVFDYGTVGTINGLFFETNAYNNLVTLMVENQAYSGYGFQDGSKKALSGDKYTFTLDEAHVYGDEACFSDENSEYYGKDKSALVGTTWCVGDDCSALKSETREKEFQKKIDELNFGFGIDDIKLSAKAKFFEDTVNVIGDATVKATTNTGFGCEKVESVSNGGKVETNDYFGTIYTIASANKPTVKYNGEELTVAEEEGAYTVTIPASSVTKNGTLNVNADLGAEEPVVVYKEDFQDYADGAFTNGWGVMGNNKYYVGGFESDSTGNRYAVVKDWKADALIQMCIDRQNVENESQRLIFNIYPRISVSNPGYEFKKDVAYKVAYNFKYTENGETLNVTGSAPFFTTSGIITKKEGCDWRGGSKEFYTSGTAGTELNGWRNTSVSDFTAAEITDGSVTAVVASNAIEFKGFNNKGNLISNLAKEAFDSNTADGATNKEAASTALATELAKHDYKICLDDFTVYATAKTRTSKATFSNAKVKINGQAMVSGESVKVPVGLKSNVKITAEDGYKVKSVKIAGSSVAVANDGKYTVNFAEEGDTSIEVTTEAVNVEPTVSISSFAPVTNGFEYTPTTGGDKVKIDKTAIYAYAEIALGTCAISNIDKCGIELTNKDGVTINLDAYLVPTGLKYCIRAFGDGITAGEYTVRAYIVKSGSADKIYSSTVKTTVA